MGVWECGRVLDLGSLARPSAGSFSEGQKRLGLRGAIISLPPRAHTDLIFTLGPELAIGLHEASICHPIQLPPDSNTFTAGLALPWFNAAVGWRVQILVWWPTSFCGIGYCLRGSRRRTSIFANGYSGMLLVPLCGFTRRKEEQWRKDC